MKELTKKKIESITHLRKKGHGYKAIAKRLYLSPSTVHKYARQTKLSKIAKLKLTKNQSIREQKFAKVFAKSKEIKTPHLDEKLAFVLGHLFFDGSVSKISNGQYRFNYTNSSYPAVMAFITNIHNVFGISSHSLLVQKGKNVDWYMATFSSKKVWTFVKQFSFSFSTKENIGIPNQIKEATQKIQRAFLRTFWDDEGSVSHTGALSGSSKSELMIDDLITMHHLLGIKSRKSINKTSGCYNINLGQRLEKQIKFQKSINFRFGKVTKGHNVGRFKKDVLQKIIYKKLPLMGP